MSETEVLNLRIPIERLDPHPDNYKIHTARQIDDLRASLRSFGQPRSIVVQARADAPADDLLNGDSRFLIVAGHGVTIAAEAERWESLRCDVIPATWDPERVSAYLLADNRLGELALNREDLIAKIIAEVQVFDPEMVAATGYNEREASTILTAIGDKIPRSGQSAPTTALPNGFTVPSPFRSGEEENAYTAADESAYAPQVSPDEQFDAYKLAGATQQGEIKVTYLIYLTFPEIEAFYRALLLLTQGKRNERRAGMTMASVNGMEHAGFWEEMLAPVVDAEDGE